MVFATALTASLLLCAPVSSARHARVRNPAGQTAHCVPSAACSVYAGNLSWNVKDEDLLEYMLQAGDVVDAKVMSHPDGRSKV